MHKINATIRVKKPIKRKNPKVTVSTEKINKFVGGSKTYPSKAKGANARGELNNISNTSGN